MRLLAQVTDPFGAGTPTPTAPPTATPAGGAGTSDTTLLIIAAGVLVVFLAIGWYITRDARRNLTAEDRAAVDRGDIGSPSEEDRPDRVVAPKTRNKRRKQGRAQRQARKANRPRR